MRFIADLHLHSRHSRATSKEMTPEGLWRWAQLKGLAVLGTGDFTHPGWLKELKDKLEPSGNGLFKLKSRHQAAGVPRSCQGEVSFMLQAEISSIYTKGHRVRKVHSVLLAPGFEEAEEINRRLSLVGNLASDGRPILGLDAKDLLETVLDVSPAAALIPAHAWTPHFSVFGAASGFDSLRECFEELTPHVFAIETGLSSDPPMNRRLSALDDIALISNSDAHSPRKLGREANVFDGEASYDGIMGSLRTRRGFLGTIEFFPQEGKYHYDGHRQCRVCLRPEETIKHGGLCPVCGRPLTVGVLHRVQELADRKTPKHEEYASIVPLQEMIAGVLGRGVDTLAVQRKYFALLEALGSELAILMEVPLEDISRAGGEDLGGAVARMRSGDIHISPGFDGEYGKISMGSQ
jgi:uncharacterized protein (TIGR00375 family)